MRLYFCLVYVSNFVTLWNLVKSTYTPVNNSSEYGEGYGTEWIYFPDGDDIPHNVSLIGDENKEMLMQERSNFRDIEYRLYIRSNITDSILLDLTAEPILNIDEEIKLSTMPLKVITHGWRSSAESSAVANIKDAYLRKDGVNVLTVDWSNVANSIFYYWVANQTEKIGFELATFLNALSAKYNISGDQIHLIGHSLGAHVMGIAAFKTKLSIDRITGLDPARPLFEYPSRNNEGKLDSTDANFVDIIHTCSGVLGIELDVGSVDFYPNGGIPPQPGCETIPYILEACSHGRSFHYFAESIEKPKAFTSYHCSNWTQFLENRCIESVHMGEEVSRDVRGKFYLKTNAKFPFGRPIFH